MTRTLLAAMIIASLAACAQDEAPATSPAADAPEDAAQAAPEAAPATAVEPAASGPHPVETFDSEHGQVRVTTLARGLEHPWGLAFLPDGRALVTERAGRLRIMEADGSLGEPVGGVPEVVARGQGGLLDVALSPDFDTDGLVYLAYSEAGDGGSSTAVARGRLDVDTLSGVEVVFRQTPKIESGHHFGARLVFNDGYLFITLGDRGQRISSQELDSHMGAVIRIRPDGDVPQDNPFVGDDAALDEIYSYGHRNIQGAAVHPDTGALWTHEHGPRGGDEINLPRAGANFGWPLVTHGINYSGEPIPEARGTEMDGMAPAAYVWEASPGVSGMAFYTAESAPAWQGNLFVGALAQTALIRLELDGEEVVHEERLLTGMGRRIRDVRQGPNGALYLLTDRPDGEVLKVELLAD